MITEAEGRKPIQMFVTATRVNPANSDFLGEIASPIYPLINRPAE
jgi:hypothetical protein